MNNHLTNRIIDDLKKGSHKAYEIIFLTYFPKVKYYIKGFVKDSDIAEELAQNVFMKIWENHESPILSTKTINSYIFTIAYRETIDYIRNKQVRESFYNDQIVLEEDTTCLEEEYIAQETRLLIEMEIENMPQKRRKIYKMSRSEGIPNYEIAKQLNVSQRTVENQLSLAMKKIREIVY